MPNRILIKKKNRPEVSQKLALKAWDEKHYKALLQKIAIKKELAKKCT